MNDFIIEQYFTFWIYADKKSKGKPKSIWALITLYYDTKYLHERYRKTYK